MSETETMLVEIGTICNAFKPLVGKENARLLGQFEQVCEKARLEITEKDKRITELESALRDLRDTLSEIHRPYLIQKWEETDKGMELSRVRHLAGKTLAAFDEVVK